MSYDTDFECAMQNECVDVGVVADAVARLPVHGFMDVALVVAVAAATEACHLPQSRFVDPHLDTLPRRERLMHPSPGDWYRVAAAASHARLAARMESDTAAPDTRATFMHELVAARVLELEVYRRRQQLVVAKARVLLDRVVIGKAIEVCVSDGLLAAFDQACCHAHQLRHDVNPRSDQAALHWVEGARALFGPMVARLARPLLSRLRLPAVLARRDPAHPHTLSAFGTHLSDLWDRELQTSCNASNAAVLLMRGIHTADGRPLYADVAHAISRVLDPNAAHPRTMLLMRAYANVFD